ncbi:MAG TPA: N-acetyl-gamma-glutamyl-phosphate reductase [Devosia sp.]|nr:N-acetyl-gamma-glutamyl-phosphate reductase [Devosia sp.]
MAGSARIANPGCWPQGAIATVRPLVEAGILPADHPLTVHGISGYTGGGRTMIADYEAAGEAASEFMPYGLTFRHKHLPELQTYARLEKPPLFTPAVGNFAQGMITMVPLQLWALPRVPTGRDLHAAIADHFATIRGGFVEVAPLLDAERTPELDPELYNGTNRMRLHVFASDAKAQAARIAGSARIANPGCWPQGAIATVRPLVEAGLLPADHPVTVHGISGYTGGGRTMIADYEAAGEDASEFMPYGLTFKHKHLPELQTYARLEKPPLFTPAVGNFAQGMITMVPLQLWALPKVPTGRDLHAAIADHFATIRGGFVEVAPLLDAERTPELDPELYNGTNRMRLHVFASDAKAQAVLVAVYDNLGKGASGAAVQNLNLMLGVAEDTSLAA